MYEENPISSILIVDDDEALLQALPQAVHLRMHHVHVDIADAGPRALELIQKYDYDAIVSDVKMPGMDGIELLMSIRELRSDTPVIFITGHGDHDVAIRALRGGAYDYILKPIDRDAFIAALQRAIQTYQLRRKVGEQQVALALHARSLEHLVEKRTSELATTNAAKDKLLTIISHELKVPLSNIKSMAHLMRRHLEQGETSSTVLQGLVDMERSINRTEILAQDLLDTSMMETNMFVLHRQRCDLVALCRDLLNEYTAGSVHNLVCEFMGEQVEVEVDSNRIGQVLINLLSNARKYAAPSSPITISLQQSGYEVVLTVSDRGVGIPSDEMPHIFEQFYRVPGIEVQTGVRSGLGLGLYISRKIVERHGGHIEVQSTVGQGSAFSIVLPVYINPDVERISAIEPTIQTHAIWTMTH